MGTGRAAGGTSAATTKALSTMGSTPSAAWASLPRAPSTRIPRFPIPTTSTPNYVYADPYPVYPPPAVVVVQPPPVIELAPIQREVIYPTGRYALHGDGVSYPCQWIWIPAAPPPPP